jgi:hypothetical protein
MLLPAGATKVQSDVHTGEALEDARRDVSPARHVLLNICTDNPNKQPSGLNITPSTSTAKHASSTYYTT